MAYTSRRFDGLKKSKQPTLRCEDPKKRKVEVFATFAYFAPSRETLLCAGGVPCLRGLRIPVATVVGMVAEGMSVEEILKAYPDPEREDISEALRYAAEAVREREIPLVSKP